MRNISNAQLKWRSLPGNRLLHSPSNFLQRYSHIVTLELYQPSQEKYQPCSPWKVDIFPPTIVTLRLWLSNAIYRITDLPPKSIAGTNTYDLRTSTYYSALATDPSVNFLDLNLLFPRCETLVIEETVNNIALPPSHLVTLAERAAAKLPQSLTHLQHRLIANYFCPNLLPASLTSMMMRNVDFETMSGEKANSPLERLEIPYDFAIRSEGRIVPALSVILENLKHNFSALKYLKSSLSVPVELFASSTQLVTIDLRDCDYNNLTQYPLQTIYTHMKSLEQLYIAVGITHLPILAANIPRRLTLLSLQDTSVYHISNPTSHAQRAAYAPEVVARLPSTLRYLAFPGILPFTAELASQLPQGLREVIFWNCDVDDTWIKNLPPQVNRLAASRFCYSGIFLPSDFKGQLVEADISRLSLKGISKQRPNMHIDLSSNNFEGTYDIRWLPDGVTRAIDISLDHLHVSALPSALERYSLASASKIASTDSDRSTSPVSTEKKLPTIESLLPLLPPRLKSLNFSPHTGLPWTTFKVLPKTLIRTSGAVISFGGRACWEEVARFALPSSKLHIKQSLFDLIEQHFPLLFLGHKQVTSLLTADDVKFLGGFNFEAIHCQNISANAVPGSSPPADGPVASSSANGPSMPSSIESTPETSLSGLTLSPDAPIFANLTSFSASGEVHLIFDLLPSTLTYLDLFFKSIPSSGIAPKITTMTGLKTLKLGGVPIVPYLTNCALPVSITHLTLYRHLISTQYATLAGTLPALKTLELHYAIDFAHGHYPIQELTNLPTGLTDIEFREPRMAYSWCLRFLPSSLKSIKICKKEMLIDTQWKKAWEKTLASRSAPKSSSDK